MRLFVNQLTVMDFSYLHPERGLLGESWLVDIELEGGLDEQGMVLDFGDVKHQVKQTIDREFDHKLLVPARHPGLVTQAGEARISLSFPLDAGKYIRHTGPAAATTFVSAAEVTPEAVSVSIIEALQRQLPANVKRISLNLYPESIEGAWYQYSHGLKHHCGNCQRIAHGHRSRIDIKHNGQRNTALESEWARRFEDIYIGTREDLREKTRRGDTDYLLFAYAAQEGNFELELPADCCYLIDTESTVENIAQHIADELGKTRPAEQFEVRAYEGVNKGAIANPGQALDPAPG